MMRRCVRPRLRRFAMIGACTLSIACGKDRPQSASDGKAGGPTPARPGVFTNPAANPASVRIVPDSARVASALISSDGGSISATGADGTQFVLTIPPNALLSGEQVSVTPMASLTGLPGDASTVAAVQLEPSGLLLLEPAKLEIKTQAPVDRAREIPIAWSESGADVHLHPLVRRSASTVFEVVHFSGFAIASGSDAVMNAIQAQVPASCGERIFRELNEQLAERRRAALLGDESGIADIVQKMIQLAQSYLNDIIRPLVASLNRDDTLLPCALSEVVTFDRTMRLVAGDSAVDANFRQPLEDTWMTLYKAVGTAFTKTHDRCMRNESPIFQFQRMAAAERLLVSVGLAEVLPENHVAMLQECGRSIEYRVDVNGSIDNVYAEQGRGFDFVSSKSDFKTGNIRFVFDEKATDMAKEPTFKSERMPLDVTIVAVPRGKCPNKARVRPGSYFEGTITPVLNPRVGKLVCGGGKARCEGTDVNPGVMVSLAPQVVEETWLFTSTGSSCMPPTEWNEWMMMWEGSQSTGAFEPFQVRGDGTAAIVRLGGPKRGYGNFPAIRTSRAVIKANVVAVRK